MLQDDIFALDDLPRREVPCPEWAAALGERKLFVRTLQGHERDALEAESFRLEEGAPGHKLDNFRARLLARAVVDEQGEQVFTDPVRLGGKSSVVLDRMYDLATELNKMRKTDIEGAEKNSAAAPSGASGSSSPTATVDPSASSSSS